MTKKRPVTTISSPLPPDREGRANTHVRNSGGGFVPMTLSTAIFSGNGVSNTSGIDNKLTRSVKRSCRR